MDGKKEFYLSAEVLDEGGSAGVVIPDSACPAVRESGIYEKKIFRVNIYFK